MCVKNRKDTLRLAGLLSVLAYVIRQNNSHSLSQPQRGFHHQNQIHRSSIAVFFAFLANL